MKAVTLFTRDLEEARRFYSRFFDSDPIYEDKESLVFQAGSTMVNLLRYEAVPGLLEPARMSTEGIRAVYSVEVEDVDRAIDRLRAHGIHQLNGPVDQPWGVRMACFVDPSGHVWELAQDIAQPPETQ